MILDFIKISATGNDFIILDNREQLYKPSDTPLWVKLCERRTGIGADGVLLLNNSSEYDFEMSIINADGSIGEMCANGARALCLYAHKILGLKDDPLYTFSTLSGVYQAEVLDDVHVKLQMTQIHDIQKYDLTKFGFSSSFFVDTGVPHALFEVENLNEYDVNTEGARIAHDEIFPKGTNVNFYQRKEDGYAIRTFERGVEGETLSCGTGVTALAVMANKLHQSQERVLVEARGGDLQVDFNSDLSQVFLIGPANIVFLGKTQLEFR